MATSGGYEPLRITILRLSSLSLSLSLSLFSLSLSFKLSRQRKKNEAKRKKNRKDRAIRDFCKIQKLRISCFRCFHFTLRLFRQNGGEDEENSIDARKRRSRVVRVLCYLAKDCGNESGQKGPCNIFLPGYPLTDWLILWLYGFNFMKLSIRFAVRLFTFTSHFFTQRKGEGDAFGGLYLCSGTFSETRESIAARHD